MYLYVTYMSGQRPIQSEGQGLLDSMIRLAIDKEELAFRYVHCRQSSHKFETRSFCSQLSDSRATKLLQSIMVSYTVYAVIFTTVLGTCRTYIGFTRSLDMRASWHYTKPVAWMKCAKGRPGEWKYKVLKSGT